MTVTPQEVLKALSDPSIGAEVHRVVHQYSDKDQGDGALHHTLGRIDGQALPHYVADEDFVGTDDTVPNPPTGLTVTPSVYFRANGTAAVRVHFSWTAPPLNTDGSAFEDFKYYETQWRQNGDTAWTGTVQTDANEVFYENFNPGDTIDLQVRAVDTSLNESTWAEDLFNVLDVDSSAPGTPSTPTLDNTTFFGMIRVIWDGLDDTAATMPEDFDRTEVHASTVSGFTPDGTTLRDTLFSAAVSDVFGNVGETLYIKLVAYDKSDNFSSPSAEVSSTILGASTTDLQDAIISNQKIVDDAIDAAKIAAGAVGTSEIAALAVTAAELADDAVTTSKILAGAVTELELADAAVTNAKVATDAIGPLNIQTDAVTTAKIAADAVTQAELAANAVDTAAIQDGAVATGKYADLSIVEAKIVDAAIATAKIADAAITNAKIGALAVGTANIADAAIVNAKIGNLEVDAAKIADLAVTSAKIALLAVGSAQIADAAIVEAKIGAAAINTAAIQDAAIVTAKIGDASISTAKIQDASISTAKIIDLAVSTAKIANLAVGTAQIADLAVSNAKIGLLAVGTANIGDAVITTAKIGDAQILTAKIADAQITNAKINDLAVSKLTAGTLSADVTVSSRIKTADSGARAEMDSSGFHVYNASGTEVAALKISAGVPVLFVTDGTIEGGTITGALFRTAASGMRIEMGSDWLNDGSSDLNYLLLYTGDASEVEPGALIMNMQQGTTDNEDAPYVTLGTPEFYSGGRSGIYLQGGQRVEGTSEQGYVSLYAESTTLPNGQLYVNAGGKIDMQGVAHVDETTGGLRADKFGVGARTGTTDYDYSSSAAYFTGAGALILQPTTVQDVDLTNDGQPISIGKKEASGRQLIIDDNEVQVRIRNAGNTAWSADTLNLNYEGGNVVIGAASSTVSIPGTITNTTISSPSISTPTITGGPTISGGGTWTGGPTISGATLSNSPVLNTPIMNSGDATIQGAGNTLTVASIPTTASAANAFINANGRLVKSTSSRRYKKNIIDLPDEYATKLLKLRPVQFESRKKDDGGLHIGFIAEEAHKLGLTSLVNYDKKNRPDGFAYDRVAVIHHDILRQHEARIAELERLLGGR